jgi:acyl carrier protein
MVFEKIQGLISEQLNLSQSEIKMETSFRDDLNADSLDLFQIIMGIEEEYEIEISNEEVEKLDTVGDIVEFIKEQKELD